MTLVWSVFACSVFFFFFLKNKCMVVVNKMHVMLICEIVILHSTFQIVSYFSQKYIIESHFSVILVIQTWYLPFIDWKTSRNNVLCFYVLFLQIFMYFLNAVTYPKRNSIYQNFSWCCFISYTLFILSWSICLSWYWRSECIQPSSLNCSKWSSISDFKITAFVQSPAVAYLDISLQISLFLGCVPWRSKKWCLLPSVDSHVSLMQFDIRKLTSILPSLFRVGFITGDLTNVSSTKYLPKK